MGLDSDIDVFGDQHHISVWVAIGKGSNHRQNLVVSLSLQEPADRGNLEQFGLKKESTDGIGVTQCVQAEALTKTVSSVGGQGLNQGV